MDVGRSGVREAARPLRGAGRGLTRAPPGAVALGVETADLPLVPARPGSREIQWQLAGAPAVKMTVTRAGVVRVPAESLFAAGVPVGTPAAALRLFREARPVARAVLAADGRTLQRGDAVEFYGYGMDTRYSGVAVYWLTAGAGQGRNMQVAPAAAEDAALALLPRCFGDPRAGDLVRRGPERRRGVLRPGHLQPAAAAGPSPSMRST